MSKSIEDKIWAIIDVQGYPPAKPSETSSETDIATKKIMKLIEPIIAENEQLRLRATRALGAIRCINGLAYEGEILKETAVNAIERELLEKE